MKCYQWDLIGDQLDALNYLYLKVKVVTQTLQIHKNR